MKISKLKKNIIDELTTMESHFGDMDITELSLVDRSDRLDISYKTASPIDPRKVALDNIKDKIRDAVRYFNEDFEPLTDAEKASIKSYIELNDKGKLGSDEQKLADYFGVGNYTTFYKKHFIQNRFSITKDDFIAGVIPVMFLAMKKLGIKYKHDDYPEQLRKYLYRKIWETKLGYIKDKVFNEYLINPIFIKPKDKLKKFTGFLLNSRDDWFLTNGAADGTNIICSEPVKWVTEYRIPVINKIPRDYCNYFGNPDIQVDKSVVQNIIDDWTDSPKAYCLDVGVLDTGETALIEINDAFSCGSYSMSAETYGDLLTTRWNELKG